MDFGALRPEINSGRMYAGSGSGSMRTAANAWHGLAADLRGAASSYHHVIMGMTAGSWLGPASTRMAAAMTPYKTWMSLTAAQCEQMAAQAGAAASAYEAAFAMTVPPTQVSVNRTNTRSLIRTNYWGQNAPSIAMTEAQYGEMWAQDAAAMYEYAGASAAATTTPPFQKAPQTVNPGGQLAQSGAVTQANTNAAGTTQEELARLTSAVPRQLQALAAPGDGTVPDPDPGGGLPDFLKPVEAVDTFHDGYLNPMYRSVGIVDKLMGVSDKTSKFQAAAVKAADSGLKTVSAAPALAGAGAGGSAVSAGLGRATMVGAMSAPQSWATSVASSTPAAATLSSAPSWASAGGGTPGHMVGGLPHAAGMGGAGRGMGNGVVKVGLRPFIMPRPPAAG